jgi:hypothetical protein
MRYQGSEAFDLTRREAARQDAWQDPFVVVEGGHLDEDARRGVSREFLVRAAVVCGALVFLFAIGWIRVSLTTTAVALMEDNVSLSSDIRDAESLTDDLASERSLLRSADRIIRIATQNYGMVYAPGTEAVSSSTYAEANSAAAMTAAKPAEAATDESAAEGEESSEGDFSEGDGSYYYEDSDSEGAFESPEGSGDAAQSYDSYAE